MLSFINATDHCPTSAYEVLMSVRNKEVTIYKYTCCGYYNSQWYFSNGSLIEAPLYVESYIPIKEVVKVICNSLE